MKISLVSSSSSRAARVRCARRLRRRRRRRRARPTPSRSSTAARSRAASTTRCSRRREKSYKTQKRDVPEGRARPSTRSSRPGGPVPRPARAVRAGGRELGIEVTDKDVDERLDADQEAVLRRRQKKYEEQLKEQGLTDDAGAQPTSAPRSSREKLFNEVTKEIEGHRRRRQGVLRREQGAVRRRRSSATCATSSSRRRRRPTDLYDQLKDGADFAALAKKYSQDPGSKDNGGKLTISKGQTVAPFDQTAFLLEDERDLAAGQDASSATTSSSRSAPSRPAKVTPLAEVKESIRQQLQQTQKNEAMTKWVEDLKKEYEDKVAYAVGFTPSAGRPDAARPRPQRPSSRVAARPTRSSSSRS